MCFSGTPSGGVSLLFEGKLKKKREHRDPFLGLPGAGAGICPGALSASAAGRGASVREQGAPVLRLDMVCAVLGCVWYPSWGWSKRKSTENHPFWGSPILKTPFVAWCAYSQYVPACLLILMYPSSRARVAVMCGGMTLIWQLRLELIEWAIATCLTHCLGSAVNLCTRRLSTMHEQLIVSFQKNLFN